MKIYDIIIIGGGGALNIRPAADLGKKVAIIEKESLGGTCLNRGCIPSKMCIYPSDLLTHIKEDAEKLNMNFSGNLEIDFPKLVERTQVAVKSMSDSIAPAYDKHENIDFYHGHGKFISNKIVEVNGEEITATKIYVATGSKPQIPNIPGLAGTPFFTSRELLENTKKPQKMIVIGGGYIATELGHFYGAAGVDVHFLIRSEMLKNEDKDIRAEFSKSFDSRYNLHYGVSPTNVSYENGTFSVTLTSATGEESIMKSDVLFVATGVVPVSDELGLENTAITRNKRGYIEVNDHLETAAEGIYAMGDVVGNYLFRHSVNFEAQYLFRQHYTGEKRSEIQYPPMPHAVFTYPQIAGVGLTEDELLAEGKIEGKDYIVGINNYSSSAMGDAMVDPEGFVKIMADPKTGLIFGAHIVGEKASDIIHMLILAISKKITVAELLRDMIFIHPALSEVILNALLKVEKKMV